MGDILAIDVGTTMFKLGVFSQDMKKKAETSVCYEINLYGGGKSDIEPDKWWEALRECCTRLKDALVLVKTISLSVTTPGLVPMAEDGTALGPAILFCDGRSHAQARWIREKVGEDKFLRETCNLPVSGGSSLCSILWIRENQPDVWRKTARFGHCNTYMVKRFTGEWAIEPSTVSITGLYNSARNDLTWNRDVLNAAGISETRLPPLMQSYHAAGKILPGVASELGLPADCDVLCGGNDATLAALSCGLTEPGSIGNVSGTCEITSVCLAAPISSGNFNIRCHVIPGRWLTFCVLNTGGKALEWFHSVFCRDMTPEQFYERYIPSVLSDFFGSVDIDREESGIPEYIPFLQGSRYSMEQLKAGFSGLTLETTRDKVLLAVIKGNAVYHGKHLKEMAAMVNLSRKVMVTGGGAKIPGFIEVKKRWTGDFEYEFQEQSSLLGAAILGQFYQTGRYSYN